MEERDIRLLFQADHWAGASIVPMPAADGWQVVLQPKSKDEKSVVLSCKRGGKRIFKTSDSAITWCQQIGFGYVRVQLEPINHESEDSKKYLSNSTSILLIEDNPDEAELTVLALRKNKIADQIIVKHNGQDALDYLFDELEDASNFPSLIILDLGLPGVGGLDVLEKIRNSDATKCLPVVVLTISDNNQDIRRSYELGINSYVFKPTDYSKFSQVIEQMGMYWSDLNIFPMR